MTTALATGSGGRVALVTGATGAIGTSTVRRLSADFDHVVVTDLDAERCRLLAAELGAAHLGLALDVTNDGSWADIVEVVRHRFGRLDALVNNAAISTPGSVVDETIHRWHKVIAVGQTGTWLGMKHCGPLIAASGGGSIVNMCSILGTVGVPHSFSYQAVKGAVRSMTKSAALYWAEHAVRVNSLHPGYVRTPGMDALMQDPGFRDSVLSNLPVGRLATTSEVAAAVAYLASDDAAFMTGSEMYIDGGTTAR